MRFNISKCFVMRITQSKSMITSFTTLLLIQSVIVNTWGLYSKITGILRKANSTLGMMCRNIKKAPMQPKNKFISSAWSPWLRQDIQELEKVQCRAAPFVHSNYQPLASVSQMISVLNLESLEARRQKARLCMTSVQNHQWPHQWTTTNLTQSHPQDLTMDKPIITPLQNRYLQTFFFP